MLLRHTIMLNVEEVYVRAKCILRGSDKNAAQVLNTGVS